jgi:hypothetical protein
MKRPGSRLLRLVLLGTLALALAYLVLDRRLADRLAAQDAPIADLRRRVALAAQDAGLGSNIVGFATLEGRLAELRDHAARLDEATAAAFARLEPPGTLRARLEEPFQLVEFQNERQRRLEEVGKAAGDAGVALDAAVAGGLPMHTPDLVRPELLWAQLELVNRLLRTAIQARVAAVHEVALPTEPPGPVTEPPAAWHDVRAFLAFTADAGAALKLLTALGFTPAEARATGLPDGLAGQPALFLDRLLVRRSVLERADEVRVELVVSLPVPPAP